jgi:hypothetical protein
VEDGFYMHEGRRMLLERERAKTVAMRAAIDRAIKHF